MNINDVKINDFIYPIKSPHTVYVVLGFCCDRQFVTVQEVFLEPATLVPYIEYDTLGLIPISKLKHFEIVHK